MGRTTGDGTRQSGAEMTMSVSDGGFEKDDVQAANDLKPPASGGG
jgi:hypothetical protein